MAAHQEGDHPQSGELANPEKVDKGSRPSNRGKIVKKMILPLDLLLMIKALISRLKRDWLDQLNLITLLGHMENIEEEEDMKQLRVPSSKPTRTMSKIANTRFLNQNIYTTFLQKVSES